MRENIALMLVLKTQEMNNFIKKLSMVTTIDGMYTGCTNQMYVQMYKVCTCTYVLNVQKIYIQYINIKYTIYIKYNIYMYKLNTYQPFVRCTLDVISAKVCF